MSSFSEPQSMLPEPRRPGRLPNGLDPFADESLAGFVMRLAANHDHSSPMQLLAPLELGLSTLRQAAREGTAHPFMADYLALTPIELERLSSGQGTCSRVLGHELDRDLVVLGGRKLCPVCIAEQPIEMTAGDVIDRNLPAAGVSDQQVVAEEAEVGRRKCDTPRRIQPGPPVEALHQPAAG